MRTGGLGFWRPRWLGTGGAGRPCQHKCDGDWEYDNCTVSVGVRFFPNQNEGCYTPPPPSPLLRLYKLTYWRTGSGLKSPQQNTMEIEEKAVEIIENTQEIIENTMEFNENTNGNRRKSLHSSREHNFKRTKLNKTAMPLSHFSSIQFRLSVPFWRNLWSH